MLKIIQVLLLICKLEIAKVIIEFSLFAIVFRIDKHFNNNLVELDNNKVENCFEFKIFVIQDIVEDCIFFFDDTFLCNRVL